MEEAWSFILTKLEFPGFFVQSSIAFKLFTLTISTICRKYLYVSDISDNIIMHCIVWQHIQNDTVDSILCFITFTLIKNISWHNNDSYIDRPLQP